MKPVPQFEYTEKRGWFARYGVVFGVVVVALVGVTLVTQVLTNKSGPAPRKAQEMVMIKPVAPPPPPPPPPPTPTPQNEPKEQMMEQTPVDEQEAKPDAAPDPGPELGTNVQGNGPADSFGLGGNKKGMIGGGGGGKGGGSRFGWYANLVIRAVSEALRQNDRTRNASFNIKVRIWSDLGGRVTRTKLEPTGDPAVDEVIKKTVLANFQLPEPPPEGMPMPMVMRLTARRPN